MAETRVERYLRLLREYQELDYRKSDDVPDEEEERRAAELDDAWIILEPQELDEVRQGVKQEVA